jgi:hypothetical protein
MPSRSNQNGVRLHETACARRPQVSCAIHSFRPGALTVGVRPPGRRPVPRWFELDRDQAAESGLPAAPVVGRLDPSHDRDPQLLPGGPGSAVEESKMSADRRDLIRALLSSSFAPRSTETVLGKAIRRIRHGQIHRSRVQVPSALRKKCLIRAISVTLNWPDDLVPGLGFKCCIPLCDLPTGQAVSVHRRGEGLGASSSFAVRLSTCARRGISRVGRELAAEGASTAVARRS